MENNTSKINSIKKFFFDTVLKQGGQTALKEAAKLLSKLKISLGNINISPIIQIKSNNGITIGQDWHISAGELLGRISEQERQELGKFSKLLMETFTKNGGGMKSTAYLELERNLMVKEAKKAISPGQDSWQALHSAWCAACSLQASAHSLQALAQTLASAGVKVEFCAARLCSAPHRASIWFTLLAHWAVLQQGAMPEVSGCRTELKEVPAAGDRGADSMSITLPPDPAGELPAGENPSLSRLPGARRETGRKVPLPGGENEAGEQAASAPDGDDGSGVASALRSPREGTGREGGRESGGDASRKRSRGAEAARNHSSEELPRSAERTESRMVQ